MIKVWTPRSFQTIFNYYSSPSKSKLKSKLGFLMWFSLLLIYIDIWVYGHSNIRFIKKDLEDSDKTGTKLPDIVYPSRNNYFLRPFYYCPVIKYGFSFIYKMK